MFPHCNILAVIVLLVCGCSSTVTVPATKPGTPEVTRTVGQHLTAAQYSATAAKSAITEIPAGTSQSKALAHTETAIEEIRQASEANENATEQAERDARAMAKAISRIQELEKKDPLVVTLNWLAYGLIAIGAILLALHWFWLKLDWGDNAGAACLVSGSIIAAVAYWMPTIRSVVLVVVAGAGVFAAFREWRKYRKTAASVSAASSETSNAQ